MSPIDFDAFALPSRIGGAPVPPELTLLRYEEPGIRVRYVDATPDWIGDLADALADAREGLRARRAADIAAALGRTGARFHDPDDPVRARALELLPRTSGLSPEMAEVVLGGMAADWTEERLFQLLRAELGDERVLDGFVVAKDPARGASMAVGPSLCVQIVSGSVPGVGVSALVRSLLLKGPTLLKPGRGDVVLPVLFARALREADPELADALAVVYWPGGEASLEDAALARADVVSAYGADETVAALRSRTPITARFVAYHHRVSVGVVGRHASGGGSLASTASEVAEAVAVFDRRGCVSPQLVLVEDPDAGAETALTFAEALAGALERLELRLPSGRLEGDEASALQQLRGTAELMTGQGGAWVAHGGARAWTVIVEKGETSLGGCAGRTVSVRPFRDLPGLYAQLKPLASHLQTVGIAGLGDRVEEIARGLGGLGASRVVPFEAVPFPPPWWHHDGGGPLLDLIRWVDLGLE